MAQWKEKMESLPNGLGDEPDADSDFETLIADLMAHKDVIRDEADAIVDNPAAIAKYNEQQKKIEEGQAALERMAAGQQIQEDELRKEEVCRRSLESGAVSVLGSRFSHHPYI